MAVVVDLSIVPTVDHAHVAAELLAAEGASRVLLHGSVAEGTAGPGSDVDLVAVFDDIDYAGRLAARWRLEAKCTAAAGAPVEVHVTDWPEWRHRTERVGSSFEAAVARHAQTLFDRTPTSGAVQWEKRIGMPDSDTAECVRRMNDVEQSLGRMRRAIRQDPDETSAAGGRVDVNERVRLSRLRGLCADAAMTVENALKAWCALNGAPSERTHSIARVLESAGPLPTAVSAALAALRVNSLRPSKEDYDDISGWRIAGTYVSQFPQASLERCSVLAGKLAEAALAATGAVLGRLDAVRADSDDEVVAECRRLLLSTRSMLDTIDMATGETA